MHRDIAVEALMECLLLQEVGSGAGGGGRSLAVPVDIRAVVRARPNGCLAGIQLGGDDRMVSNIATQFQITVGNGASGISKGAEMAPDRPWEAVTPEASAWTIVGGEEENTAHASASGVTGSSDCGGGGNELRNASWAGGDVPGEAAELG